MSVRTIDLLAHGESHNHEMCIGYMGSIDTLQMVLKSDAKRTLNSCIHTCCIFCTKSEARPAMRKVWGVDQNQSLFGTKNTIISKCCWECVQYPPMDWCQLEDPINISYFTRQHITWPITGWHLQINTQDRCFVLNTNNQNNWSQNQSNRILVWH